MSVIFLVFASYSYSYNFSTDMPISCSVAFRNVVTLIFLVWSSMLNWKMYLYSHSKTCWLHLWQFQTPFSIGVSFFLHFQSLNVSGHATYQQLFVFKEAIVASTKMNVGFGPLPIPSFFYVNQVLLNGRVPFLTSMCR